MSLTDLPPFPLRVSQGIPISSQAHDDIHEGLRLAYNILSAAVNQLVINSGVIPAGVVEDFAGTSLPTGYLWCDGSTKSQSTYPALYLAIGTTWNTGGEGAGNFRLPKAQGRVSICANPLNGISADTPTLSTRTLGVKYGTETSSVTFPTFSPGTFPALTGGVLPSSSGGSFPALTGGALPSSSGGNFPALIGGALASSSGGAFQTLTGGVPPTLIASGGGNITSETKSGVTINGQIACVGAGIEGAAAAGCSTLSVADFSVDFSKATIISAITFDSGSYPDLTGGSFPVFDAGSFQTLTSSSFPTFDAGSFQTLTGGSFPTFIAGSFPTLTAGTPPSSSGGSNTTSTMQPSICLNKIIKY